MKIINTATGATYDSPTLKLIKAVTTPSYFIDDTPLIFPMSAGWQEAPQEILQDETELLKDQLDSLYMQYLSQVSLWKSRYEEVKKQLQQSSLHH